MRAGLYLGTAAMGAALALWAIGRVNGPGSFMLEVPAQDLSVGQQFQPRLVDTRAGVAVPETVSVELLDAGGHRLASQELEFTGAPAVAGAPWSLPRPGAYRVRASSPSGTQTVALEAQPEPAGDFGGVAAVTALGLPAGAGDYLRQHGFVVTEADGDAATALPANPVIVVGDPRLEVAPADLTATYTALWHAVEGGARLLQLEPPPPGVQPYWPLNAPLVPVSGACPSDGPMSWPLAPQLSYDLSGKSTIDIYHWDGTFMLRADRAGKIAGYPGCHALFSYRYGEGWVTVSSVPLLQHFQDVRARLDLMALIKAQLHRKHTQPASPGLAWVMRQKLAVLSKTPPAPLAAAAALHYLAPPAPVRPAPVLVPLAAGDTPPSCWSSPAPQAAGAALSLDFSAPQTPHQLALAFGADRSAWPAGFQIEGTNDGVHWSALAAPAIASTGALLVTVPAPAAPYRGWRAFQLTLTANSARAWRVCQFDAR